MHCTALRNLVQTHQSCLCVGLDTDPSRLPAHLSADYQHPVLAFNKAVIAATAPYCIAYKINTAFYEALGARGWELMENTIRAIPAGKMVIADAKRGDIGNTATQYARAFFENLNVDAVTISPYMGKDAVVPFLNYADKSVIVLALTSNASAADFQYLPVQDKPLYRYVMEQACAWADKEQLMFVVGATKSGELKGIRQAFPEHALLVPGVGSQGGNLQHVLAEGLGPASALMVNVSRDILYQSAGEDFAEAAGRKAAAYQAIMANFL